jgi:hypothetical protein
VRAEELGALPQEDRDLLLEFLALGSVREMRLALRLHGWMRTPAVRYAQKVIKPAVALALRDETLLQEVENQVALPE